MKLYCCFILLLAAPSAVLAVATIGFEQIQPGMGEPDITDFAIEISKVELVSGSPFTADQLNSRELDPDTGQLPTLFHNGANKTFTDFHVLAISPESLEGFSFLEDGSPFFDKVKHTIIAPPNQEARTVRFDFSGGTGISHCTYFAISVDGFPEGTTFSLVPTIPAPGALTLCALGALLTHGLRRRQSS